MFIWYVQQLSTPACDVYVQLKLNNNRQSDKKEILTNNEDKKYNSRYTSKDIFIHEDLNWEWSVSENAVKE